MEVFNVVIIFVAVGVGWYLGATHKAGQIETSKDTY